MLSRTEHAIEQIGHQPTFQVVDDQRDVVGRLQIEVDGGRGIERIGMGCQAEVDRLLDRLDTDSIAFTGAEGADLLPPLVVFGEAEGAVAELKIATIRIAEKRILDDQARNVVVVRPGHVVPLEADIADEGVDAVVDEQAIGNVQSNFPIATIEKRSILPSIVAENGAEIQIDDR